MTKNCNLYRSIKQKGKPGEDAVAEWLCEKYDDGLLTDVSLDKKYQDMSIDFIITTDKDIYIEVKNDYSINRTGNIALELLTDTSRGIDGWFAKMLATKDVPNRYLAYRDAIDGTIYWINIDELIDFYYAHKCDFRVVYPREEDYSKYSMCLLVPLYMIKNITETYK